MTTLRRLAFTVVGLASLYIGLLWLGVSVMAVIDPGLAFDDNSSGEPPPRLPYLLECLAAVVLLLVGRHIYVCRNTKLHWPSGLLAIARVAPKLMQKVKSIFTIFYDRDFKQLREEHKQPKKK